MKRYGFDKPSRSLRSGKVRGNPFYFQEHEEPQSYMVDVFVTEDGSIEIPKSYGAVLKSADKEKWLEAIHREWDCLTKNGTWELVEKPKGAPIVGSKWVFSLKFNVDGTIKRYKARLVCQGFSQTFGVDYFETFAPVVQMNTIRMLLAMAATEFITVDKEGWVLKLKRSLYGLKQAGRNWNTLLTEFLKTIGLDQSDTDQCLFTQTDKEGNTMYLAIYVDDIIITGNAKSLIESTKAKLKERFTCSDLGEAHQLLGMVIERDRMKRRMKIHQSPYIRRMLADYPVSEGLYDFKTPAAETTNSQYVEAVFNGDVRSFVDFDYRGVVGCLMYLANTSRPDISNITRFLAQHVTDWTDIHDVITDDEHHY